MRDYAMEDLHLIAGYCTAVLGFPATQLRRHRTLAMPASVEALRLLSNMPETVPERTVLELVLFRTQNPPIR
jgi:hypothetical protein